MPDPELGHEILLAMTAFSKQSLKTVPLVYNSNADLCVYPKLASTQQFFLFFINSEGTDYKMDDIRIVGESIQGG